MGLIKSSHVQIGMMAVSGVLSMKQIGVDPVWRGKRLPLIFSATMHPAGPPWAARNAGHYWPPEGFGVQFARLFHVHESFAETPCIFDIPCYIGDGTMESWPTWSLYVVSCFQVV